MGCWFSNSILSWCEWPGLLKGIFIGDASVKVEKKISLFQSGSLLNMFLWGNQESSFSWVEVFENNSQVQAGAAQSCVSTSTYAEIHHHILCYKHKYWTSEPMNRKTLNPALLFVNGIGLVLIIL